MLLPDSKTDYGPRVGFLILLASCIITVYAAVETQTWVLSNFATLLAV